jgi:hypothetical protein
VRSNPTRNSWHRQGSGDLHAFDGASYVATRRYHLRDRVRAQGLACGPDGRVYLVLGGEAGTGLGVIEP